MIRETRVLCAQAQGLFDCGLRFGCLSCFEGGPGQGVGAVDVSPHGRFSGSVCVGLLGFQIMIGIEQSQLAIVKRAIEFVEASNFLHERVLRSSVFVTACELIKIAERGYKSWIGNNPNSMFVLLDRTRYIPLCRADTTERSKRPKVIWKGRQRVAIMSLGCRIIASRKGCIAQLPAAPCRRLSRRGRQFQGHRQCVCQMALRTA